MKNIFLILFYTLFLFSSCNNQTIEEPRKRISFNSDWNFKLADISDAKHNSFDDSSWRRLNLPHDWSIEGNFSSENPSGPGGGALPGGIAWYRKSFNVPSEYMDKNMYIDFDGVYMNSSVYVNGELLGHRPFGYISFRYDITPYLKFDQDNVIAVRVDNDEQPNSRWYSGCGIYRNVWLTVTDKVHISHWGTYVISENVTKESADIVVSTTVSNTSEHNKNIELISILQDATGNEIIRTSDIKQIRQGDNLTFDHRLNINKPLLWSIEDPYLYNVRSEVYENGALIDNYNTSTGVRIFNFDIKEGFFLNSKHVKINGVCMHHDLGALGAAVNTRAIERQLEILKEMGCNGIRTAHNPPAPELLELCDKMGFIVMDETFDMWRKKKTKHDYSRYFSEWHEQDLRDHIMRDRNHPSVFMWSVGNEVLEQWSHANADTLSLEEANLILNFGQSEEMLANDTEISVNSLLCQKLVDKVKELDKTRPVTAGCNEPNPNNHLFKSNSLDIIGYNYHEDWFSAVPENFPNKPFIAAETVSALQTRGYFTMPSDKEIIWPERWDKPFENDIYACSAYDHCHVPWGTTHEGMMRMVKNNKFVSGQYVWTGFDYLGEPTPFGFPARSSFFGIVDLAGIPKDVYYMYQSEWSDKKVLHLFPHWNWNTGQEVDMWTYYSQADEVELFVNGVSQGVKAKEPDTFHVKWRVKYYPGSVKVVSRRNGKIIAEKEIFTAGAPASIKLTPDRALIKADGYDLSYVTVEVLDKNGNICPNADNLIKFDVDGSAFIAGVDNGNPTSMESFKSPYRKAFNGKCVVIVQNNGSKGKINLTASSANIKSSTVKIESK